MGFGNLLWILEIQVRVVDLFYFFFIFSTFINYHCEKLGLSLDVENFLFILCINMYTMKKPLFCQKNAFT